MTEKEIIQIENEIFTEVVLGELRKQRDTGVGIKDYLLDRYKIEQETKERVKKLLVEQKK